MTRPPPLLLLLLLLLLLPPTISLLPTATGGTTTTTTTASDTSIGWMILGQSGSDNKPCKGSIAESFINTNNDHEFEIMSNRRILAATQYVSYGALQANKVPCSQKGASYYNCAPGASANPYTRGCSTIARCHR